MSYRVLHVLDHSWPVLDGYSLRSRQLVHWQLRLGNQPFVLTGPLHQIDDRANSEAVLDGVSYQRTAMRGALATQAILRRWPVLREAAVIHLLAERIRSLIEREGFDVIHAHSPTLSGLAAWWATRPSRIPFVYEVRAFWEDAAVDRKKTTPTSLRYRFSRILENFVARQANAVVGIARPILQDLQGRGIAANKLFYIPNGVDTDRFAPRPRDAALAAQLGLGNEPVLGFLGTLFPWEGVPWLVRAAAELRDRGASFKLLIVGDGEEALEVAAAIRQANAGEYVFFLGRVPHDQVERYYSVMDVLVYPRRRARLTELVTPLKPLEALALGKAVLASNVGGIRELIEPERTGVLFEADHLEDFCRQAARLLANQSWRCSLGERARQETVDRRDWKVVASQYFKVYEFVVESVRPRSSL